MRILPPQCLPTVALGNSLSLSEPWFPLTILPALLGCEEEEMRWNKQWLSGVPSAAL